MSSFRLRNFAAIWPEKATERRGRCSFGEDGKPRIPDGRTEVGGSVMILVGNRKVMWSGGANHPPDPLSYFALALHAQ